MNNLPFLNHNYYTAKESQRTSVMEVPASRVVLLYDGRCLIGAEQSVDSVALAPCQGVTQHLAPLLHAEIPRLEEAQDVSIFRDLQGRRGGYVLTCCCHIPTRVFVSLA